MDAPVRTCVATLAGLLVGLFVAHALHAASPADLLEGFARRTVLVEPEDNRCVAIDAWYAETPEQMRQGLMWIRELGRKEGMVFRYDPPKRASMWMKNTLIPLDIVFVGADGAVVNVAANTRPRSLRSIRAGATVEWVLELNAGSAAEWGIAPGTRVTVDKGIAAKLRCAVS
jgi:uncharacterized membrane protein (UPF0127 family)